MSLDRHLAGRGVAEEVLDALRAGEVGALVCDTSRI